MQLRELDSGAMGAFLSATNFSDEIGSICVRYQSFSVHHEYLMVQLDPRMRWDVIKTKLILLRIVVKGNASRLSAVPAHVHLSQRGERVLRW